MTLIKLIDLVSYAKNNLLRLTMASSVVTISCLGLTAPISAKVDTITPNLSVETNLLIAQKPKPSDGSDVVNACKKNFDNGNPALTDCFKAKSGEVVDACKKHFTTGKKTMVECFNAKSGAVVQACKKNFPGSNPPPVACFDAKSAEVVQACKKSFPNNNEAQTACFDATNDDNNNKKSSN